MKLICNIKNGETIILQLERGGYVLDELHLTISRNLDTLLIGSIDNLVTKNKIDRLSLKTMKILGNMRPGAVFSMIVKTIVNGLGV